jgi:predicted dehydrogenase
MSLRFAAIGLDHRHIYHLVGGLQDAGGICVGYDPATSDPNVLAGFHERFPEVGAVTDRRRLFEDPTIDVIVIAAVPSERAALATLAMRHGKDVMVDKPGVISLTQLAEVERVVRETGRIFSICFSERFVVPSRPRRAGRLIAEPAPSAAWCRRWASVPHRLNKRDPAGLVLRSRALWRHPGRYRVATRSTSSCISPARPTRIS